MAKAISVRLDEETERALQTLEASGLSRSDAIRSSLILLPRTKVVVAPTSRSAQPASFRPEVQVAGEPTRVLVEQIGAVDVQRLGESMGPLAVEEMWSVEDALFTVLGLN